MIDPTRVGTKELSEILGVTRETIRLRKNDGTLTEVARGKYNLAEAVQAYLKYVDSGHKSEGLSKARLGVEEERARKLKLENDKAEKRTLDADEVCSVFASGLITFRQRLTAIPSRIDAELAGKSDRAEIRDILEGEHRRALKDCSTELQKLAGIGRLDTFGRATEIEDSR